MRAQPVPWLTICSSRPLRRARSWVTTPRKSSGTSIETRSSGSQMVAVDLAGQHLRLADGQLEALAAHGLHEHGELQLAAALDLPGVGALGGQHAQRRRCRPAPARGGPAPAGGEPGAVAAGQRGGVDADGERQAGLVDRDHRQRPRVVGVGEGLADGDVGQAGDRDDLAGTRRLDRHAVERLGDVELAHLGRTRCVPSARHQATVCPRAMVPSCTRQMARRPT